MSPRITPDPLGQAQSPADARPGDLLVVARSHQAAAWAAEVALLETTLEWVAANGEGSVISDPYAPLGVASDVDGTDEPVDLAGPGAPLVSDLATHDLAAALGMGPDAGRRWIGDCLEIGHRLPRLHARLAAGELPVWRARRVARETVTLPMEGARFVDARVAPVAHKVGPIVLDRLVSEAGWRFDPEEAELRAMEAAESRHARVHRRSPSDEVTGTTHFSACLDDVDALDLDAALSRIAGELAEADTARQGWSDSVDVRRSRALGVLARGGSLDGGARAVTLFVHATADQVHDPEGEHRTDGEVGTGLSRCDNTRGFVTEAQVRAWLAGGAAVTGAGSVTVHVKPVIDLRETTGVDAHEVPARLVERVALARGTCAFPFCTRPASQPGRRTTTDTDHIEEGGPTSDANLAPLCRRHHRAKTHPSPSGRRWRYVRDPEHAGTFHWTSATGHRYTVDATGTAAGP